MATPSSATDIVISDGFVYPTSFRSGARIYVEENSKTTIPQVIFNQNCTLILGRYCDVTIEADTEVTFNNNCGLIMEAGSRLTIANGAKIILREGCSVDFSQGLVSLGSSINTQTKAIIELGNNTILKAGYQRPISGNGLIKAPDFIPDNTVTEQKYAVFVAPPIQVFDDGIEVIGNWHMDKAYPQWFAPSNCTNWTPPIHKAITMKRTGVVFLQRGLYKVQSSIHIPYGIQLVGEAGVRGYDYTNNKYEDSHGTIIAATLYYPSADSDSWRYFDFGSMILVNINSDKIPNFSNNTQPSTIKSNKELWSKAYPVATNTAIRSISLYNGSKRVVNGDLDKNTEVVPELTGVFVAGGCVFEKLYFGTFKQAIVKTRDYADNMQILDCTFSKCYDFNNYPVLSNGTTENDEEQDSKNALYMVQLNGSGDNLIFKSNAFHSGNKYNYALSVSNCYGGTISDNIINERVRIETCRALTFTNNHMESDEEDFYGPQIRIINSQITVSSNFFYKSEKNNIVVRGSNSGEVCVATIENNSFSCRFTEIPRNNGETDKQYEGRYNEYIERWKKRSESAEICINPGASVQIRNQYRHMNGVNYMTWPTSIGIQFKIIGTSGGELNPELNSDVELFAILNKLNTLSPYLSSQGNIKTGFKIESLLNTQENTNVQMKESASSSNVRWYSASGFYDYYAQLVFDKERRIIGTIDGNSFKHIVSSPTEHTSYYDCIINNLTLDRDTTRCRGTQISLYNSRAITIGWNATIHVFRSYRENRNDDVKYWDKVEIPISGAESLYDNGITLSGYTWKRLSTPADANGITDETPGIKSITFRNNNVECMSTANPKSSLKGTWQQGDIIYNISNDESWNLFIKK